MNEKTDFTIYASKQKTKIINKLIKNSKVGETASAKLSMTVYLGFRDEEVASCKCSSTMTSSVADRGSKCVSGNEQVGFQEKRKEGSVAKCQGIKDMNMKRLIILKKI